MDDFEIGMVIMCIFALIFGAIFGAIINESSNATRLYNLGDEMCNHEGLEFSHSEATINYKGEPYRRIVCKDVESIQNGYLIKE